jgi:hypothetical protein
MKANWAVHPRRRVRLLLLAGTVVVLYAFLSGPSGLVSILIRHTRRNRLRHEIALLRHQIEQKQTERRWLADPDSARRLVQFLLEPDTPAPGGHAPN